MAKNTITSLARTGFGLGVGLMGAQVLFMLIGALIFIPGFLLLDSAKKEQPPSTTKRVTGLVLMGLGVLIMGGVGFGFLLENLTE
jgi:hypothetical protein